MISWIFFLSQLKCTSDDHYRLTLISLSGTTCRIGGYQILICPTVAALVATVAVHLGQLVKDWLVIWLTKNNEHKYIENYQINNNVFILLSFQRAGQNLVMSLKSHSNNTFRGTKCRGGRTEKIVDDCLGSVPTPQHPGVHLCRHASDRQVTQPFNYILTRHVHVLDWLICYLQS